MAEKLKEVEQKHLEVIACVFNPDKKKWKCLSAVEVPWEKGKYEILEVDGKKFSNEFELIGFKPKEGETTWIAFHVDSILGSLCRDIKELVKTGKTTWAER